MTTDPKVLAEKFDILAALVAAAGGEVRIPPDQMGGHERLEFFFDNSTNEHVVKLGPAVETVYVSQVPQSLADPETAWRVTMPSAWRTIVSRIANELLAMQPGSDLNIAGWLDTGEHFVLCTDQGLCGRAFELSGQNFAVIETEISGSAAPYRRLSKIIVRRHP
ncbi:hypothetical protein [Luteolibacter arcticus]|nr:hypothetical protein [Luteolibacter arcticus]